MVQNPWLVFLQFCAFLTDCFAPCVRNSNVVFLFNRTNSWCINSWCITPLQLKKTLSKACHIWQNLTCFFRSWPFWTLPLGWLGFAFNAKAKHPRFVTNYDLFKQISTTSPEHCLCDKIYKSSLPHFSCFKHLQKLLDMSRTIWQHHQQPL